MKSESALDEKFCQLEKLARHCLDVTIVTVHTPQNVAAKQAFGKLRSELENIMGLEKFHSRFAPLIRKVEKNEARLNKMICRAKKATAALWASDVPYAVVRQNAIGHGGFHTGTLSIRYDRLHWVYDCGSWKRRERLTECIDEFSRRIKSDRIELLFVSHFDADHTNGLRQLLTVFDKRVDTVVVPYLNSDDMFIVLAEASARNRLTSDLIEQIIDPVRWFRQFKVRRVIRVRPPREGGNGVSADPVRGPDPELPHLKLAKLDRLNCVFIRPRGRALLGEGSIVVPAGTLAAVWADGVWCDWWFMPFVHPVSKHLKRRVRRAAERVVGAGIKTRIFRKKLLELLQTGEGRRELKNIYASEELGDANAISLSLYEGPRPGTSKQRSSYDHGDSRQSAQTGWLLTGDAKLKDDDRRSKWLDFFQPLHDTIGTLMLPHHGSVHNFHSDILSVGSKEMRLFITADESDKSRPNEAVRVAVKRNIRKVSETSRALIRRSGPSAYLKNVRPDIRDW